MITLVVSGRCSLRSNVIWNVVLAQPSVTPLIAGESLTHLRISHKWVHTPGANLCFFPSSTRALSYSRIHHVEDRNNVRNYSHSCRANCCFFKKIELISDFEQRSKSLLGANSENTARIILILYRASISLHLWSKDPFA